MVRGDEKDSQVTFEKCVEGEQRYKIQTKGKGKNKVTGTVSGGIEIWRRILARHQLGDSGWTIGRRGGE